MKWAWSRRTSSSSHRTKTRSVRHRRRSQQCATRSTELISIRTAAAGRCAPRLRTNLGLARENVILGNGSNRDHRIHRPRLSPPWRRSRDRAPRLRRLLALMAQLFGGKTVEVLDPGYRHDLDAMLASITPRTRQLFIANPNNPTGTLVGQDEIDRFMDRVPPHVLVIFDEAYYEFLDNPPDVLGKYVREGRNVVVMRTFSKIQGLANLRIGYGLAPKEIADVLQKTRQPLQCERHRAGRRHRRSRRRGSHEQDAPAHARGPRIFRIGVPHPRPRVRAELRELRPRQRGRRRRRLPGAAQARHHRPRHAQLQCCRRGFVFPSARWTRTAASSPSSGSSSSKAWSRFPPWPPDRIHNLLTGPCGP